MSWSPLNVLHSLSSNEHQMLALALSFWSRVCDVITVLLVHITFVSIPNNTPNWLIRTLYK